MNTKKLLATLTLIFIFLAATAAMALADRAAYVVSNPAYNSSVIKTALEEKGFIVDIIDDSNIGSVNWQNYKLMVVNDDFYSSPSSIPVNNVPAVVVNSYHMPNWYWSSTMGMTTSNQPLKINVVNTTHYIVNGLPGQIQVYTSGQTPSNQYIPLYYLPSYPRAPGLTIVASTMSSSYEATVAVAVNGTTLLSGKTAKARTCFYGMVEDGYWTADAKTLFKNCAYWVAYGGDYDNDGIMDDNDNCKQVYNPTQQNSDTDAFGDACDNCVNVYNPTQQNSDADNLGDSCDTCPFDSLNDIDHDTVCGDVDNCPTISNLNQANFDGDNLGDVCDPDADNDGYNSLAFGGTDCNDLNAQVNPGIIEVCNNIDDDCDGSKDDGVTMACGEGICTGIKTCSAGTWSQCSTSGNDAGVCSKCNVNGTIIYDSTQNSDCNNGLYCDGVEACQAIGQCSVGTPINCGDALFCTVDEHCDETQDKCVTTARNCSANNLPTIASCNNTPDSKPFTWDAAAGFTSTCNEASDICTSSTYTFTHTCNKTACGAECQSNTDCPKKCVDGVYYSSGICNTATTCGCSYVTEDCNTHDGWYNTTTTQWITSDLCKEKQQVKQNYRDYSCATTGCTYITNGTQWVDTGLVRNKVDNTACDDGLFCTTGDKCVSGVCQAAPRVCADTNECTADSCNEETDSCQFINKEAGALCGSARNCNDNSCSSFFAQIYPPDGHDTCNGAGACVTYSCTMQAKYCSDNDLNDGIAILACGAACDSTADCINKCVGDTYYFGGACNTTTTCGCTYSQENCNSYDGWYNTTSLQNVTLDQCRLKEQIWQEYKDYSCPTDGCSFVVSQTRWFDTGNIFNIEGSCDDGLFCTVDDACSAGVCVGAARDCSANNLPAIASCSNNPDNNPFTWDSAAGFTSTCNEASDICTSSTYTYAHACDTTNCGAGCDATNSCSNNTCSQSYDDYCSAKFVADYNNNNLKDSLLVQDSCQNSCLDSCLCTDCATDCSAPEPTLKCIVGQCGAECLPGQTETRACGLTNEGECSMGTQTRTCADSCGFAEWSECSGDLYPTEEICDALDNDCDGLIDEDLTMACGEGACAGTSTCNLGVWSQCSTSGNDAGICSKCDSNGNILFDPTQVSDCDNGLYCDGYEVCASAGSCAAGIPVDCSDGLFCTVNEQCNEAQDRCESLPRDCSANNLPEIANCDNNPDSNPFTYDSAAGFTSTCDEDANICTSSTYDYSHSCDKDSCGAQCESGADCPSKCVGEVYFSGNTCDLVTCGCTYIMYDCNSYDGWYNTTATQWVASGLCTEKEQLKQEERDYTCSGAGCIYLISRTTWVDTGAERNLADGTACNDGLFCTSGDVCMAGTCQVQPMDCSDNNECTTDSCNEMLDICTHTNKPSGTECGSARDCNEDSCDGPWALFFPADGHDTCDGAGSCVEYSCDSFASACSDNDPLDGPESPLCGAGCDSASDCANKCEGGTFYSAGVCDTIMTCGCSYTTDNCDLKDGWYHTGEYKWVDTEECVHKQQREEEYKDYTCSASDGCENYEVTDRRWADTGLVENKEDGTACDDGLFCTVNDICTTGVCGGSTRDCSANNLPEIATCGNNPDNNPLTRDAAAGFTSTCNEASDICTSSTYSFTHTCDKDNCEAECELGDIETQPCGLTNEGECSMGTQTRSCTDSCGFTEWGECSGDLYPTDEVCDNKDNDCDGIIDEGLTIICSSDSDCGIDSCVEGTFKQYTCNNAGTCASTCSVANIITDTDNDGFDTECDGDCDDTRATVYPGAIELIDSIDQNCVNDVPVLLSNIPAQSWPEDTSKQLVISNYMVDPDGDLLAYTSSEPEHISASIAGSTLILVPEQDWFGFSAATIQATDGEFTLYSNLVILEVTSVNDAPVLDHISDLIITEGELAKIVPAAIDVENDPLTFHFTSPLNADGEWQTNYSDSGTYQVTVSVTDNHGGSDSQEVLIQVLEWGNHAPELDPIGDVTITEGEAVHLTPTATDIDGDGLTFHFTAPLDSTGSWQTNYSDSGEYYTEVSVTDGKGGADSQQVRITVLESGNHAPILDPLPDLTIMEGHLIKVVPHATDPDGDALIITFTPPLDSEGVWQTTYTDAGVYTVSVGANDGELSTVKSFKITVLDSGNHNPVIQPMPDITITEGEKVSVVPIATDPDDDPITFTFSAPLDSDGEWQTTFRDQGIYPVTVMAHDGKGGTSATVFRIIVLDWGNHAPTLDTLADITVVEGDLIQVTPIAEDIDGDSLTFSYVGKLDPAGRWQTTYTDAGVYAQSVEVSDGRGGTDTKHFTITVLESGNHAPIVGPLNDLTIIEGESVQIEVVASDPDNDPLTITYTGVLDQAGFWQSQLDWIGDYDAGVIVSDGTYTVTRTFKIHVIETPYGSLMINSIRMPETAKPGETIEIIVDAKNIGTKRLDDLKVRATLVDYGEFSTSRQIDLNPGKTGTFKLYLTIPEYADEGEYDIRLSISNDEVRRTKHRPILVIG